MDSGWVWLVVCGFEVYSVCRTCAVTITPNHASSATENSVLRPLGYALLSTPDSVALGPLCAGDGLWVNHVVCMSMWLLPRCVYAAAALLVYWCELLLCR